MEAFLRRWSSSPAKKAAREAAEKAANETAARDIVIGLADAAVLTGLQQQKKKQECKVHSKTNGNVVSDVNVVVVSDRSQPRDDRDVVFLEELVRAEKPVAKVERDDATKALERADETATPRRADATAATPRRADASRAGFHETGDETLFSQQDLTFFKAGGGGDVSQLNSTSGDSVAAKSDAGQGSFVSADDERTLSPAGFWSNSSKKIVRKQKEESFSQAKNIGKNHGGSVSNGAAKKSAPGDGDGAADEDVVFVEEIILVEKIPVVKTEPDVAIVQEVIDVERGRPIKIEIGAADAADDQDVSRALAAAATGGQTAALRIKVEPGFDEYGRPIRVKVEPGYDEHGRPIPGADVVFLGEIVRVERKFVPVKSEAKNEAARAPSKPKAAVAGVIAFIKSKCPMCTLL